MSEQRSPARAVALHYKDPSLLPKVVANGSGALAQQMIDLAERTGVPVQRNDALAGMLSDSAPGQSVHPATFRLVAEVIAFLYHCDKTWREEHKELKSVIEPGRVR